MNHFKEFSEINVNDKTEKKNGLTYLSWAFAWDEIKKKYPDATYVIKKFGENQLPYVYGENTGYMVFTEVTIENITHEMWLPVMDSINKTMKDKPYTYQTKNGEKTVEACSMFDVNKTIMRCLTKNLAMFGLGLYIYAGEDLPIVEEEPATEKQIEKLKKLEDLDIPSMLKYYKITKIEQMTKDNADDVITRKKKNEDSL